MAPLEPALQGAPHPQAHISHIPPSHYTKHIILLGEGHRVKEPRPHWSKFSSMWLALPHPQLSGVAQQEPRGDFDT